MAIRIALPNPVSRFQSMRPCRLLAIKPTRTISIAPPSSPSNLASSWRLIQGSNDWNHLTDPLHPLLRSEIIRYAELVMACYKAFDLSPLSNRYLNCKHSKYRLFGGVGLPAAGYDITRYIYATPNIPIPTQPDACRSRWIGYVAVSTDETSLRLGRRDVLVSFRGTVTSAEWIANLTNSLAPARLDPYDTRPDVRVASGFLSLYTSDDSTCRFTAGSCREQLLSEISRILSKRRSETVSITVAGHSMGSALAMLLGYDLAELGMNGKAPITIYSYGGPLVGNAGFRTRCNQLGVKVLRVVNVNDPITKLPRALFNNSYEHVGLEVLLDFFKMGNPACVHDLDAYIEWLKTETIRRNDDEQGFSFFRRFESLLEMWQHGGRRIEGELVQSP